jgi:hypothetical protein
MRRLSITLLFVTIVLLAVAGRVTAGGWLCNEPPQNKPGPWGDGARDVREGGESWGDAVVIPDLPYSDSGATCDNQDNIPVPCAGNYGRDVVYCFTPTRDMVVGVSLCGSGYDTALGVYDENHTILDCNDDACDFQSEIYAVALTGGLTYYFVVDGFQSDCGSYVIHVVEREPCHLVCPDGVIPEGEPPCEENYIDNYNGGCCGGANMMPICPTDGDAAVMCGLGGTFLYNGMSYRDTDWFTVWGTGEPLTASCQAEFPLQFIFIWGTDCNNLMYDLASAPACETATLSRAVPAGTFVWIWVGTSLFHGVPCDARYILSLDNIAVGPDCPPVPVEERNWGTLKSLYR